MCTVYWLVREINNSQVDNAKDLDIVMPTYDLIEYNDGYPKTSESLHQFYRYGPKNPITDFETFKFKSGF